MPAIWQRLEAVGLSTAEACGDTPRVVLGSPVAGVSADEVLDPTPAIREIVERYIGDKAYSQPAAQVQVGRSPGCPTCPYQANDISFLGVVHPEHGPGFDLWVGGGLSTNPMLAQRLGVWVPLDEVPEVWAGVVGIFRDYGYRRLRSRARLKFLVADWGVARFREVLEGEYLQRKLIDGPAPELPTQPIDHIGVHPQRDGRFYVGVGPGRRAGHRHHAGRGGRPRRGARQRPGAAHAVPEAAGSGRAEDRVESLVAALRAIGLQARPSVWRRGTMACTGIEFCKLAIVETKAARGPGGRATWRRRSGDLDTEITINVNGCPNACARTQVADIGLKGQLVPGPGRRDGRGLPGPPGRRPDHGRRAGGRLRAQAARPQDHGRGAARVRRAGDPPLPGRRGPRASRSPSGSSRADEEELL